MLCNESVSSSLIALAELPANGIVALDAVIDGENESIIVHCNDGGHVAYLNVCPHAGRRLDYAPGKFLIDRGTLVCAAHGASFQLSDGLCVGGPCRGQSLQALPVQARDGFLYLLKSEASG